MKINTIKKPHNIVCTHEIEEKCEAVIDSCKTVPQVMNAFNYLDLASSKLNEFSVSLRIKTMSKLYADIEVKFDEIVKVND
jgi:hypothetical protein